MHALTHSQPMNDMDMYSGWPMSYKDILGDLNKGLLDDQFLKEQEYLDLLHVGHDKLDHHEHEDEEYDEDEDEDDNEDHDWVYDEEDEEENLEEYEEHIHDHLEDEERYLADLRGTSIDSALLHDTVDHAWNLDAGQKHLKQSTQRPLIYHDNLVKDHDVVHDEDEEEDLEEYEKHIHDNLEDHEDDKERYPADLRGTFIDSALLHDTVDHAWNVDAGRKHLKQSTQRPLIDHDNLVKDHDGVYDEEDEEEDLEDHYEDLEDHYEDHYEDHEDHYEDHEDHEEKYP